MAALAEAARRKQEAEARAAYEADVAAVRELRMCLRDVATRLLTDRRWRSLALPVTPQEDPEYWQRVRLRTPSLQMGLVMPRSTRLCCWQSAQLACMLLRHRQGAAQVSQPVAAHHSTPASQAQKFAAAFSAFLVDPEAGVL